MSPLEGMWLAFSLLEGVVAIYLNAFIVIIPWRSLAGGGGRNAVSLIHIAMGMNKLAMRCTWFANDAAFWLTYIFYSCPYDIIVFLLAFQLHFSYWLMAWLCIYYSIFINNFSLRMFVWIRRNLLAFMPQLLFFTGVGSMFIGLLAFLLSDKLCPPIQYSMNVTISEDVSLTTFYKIGVISLGYCLPFIGITISLLVSMLSLLKHINNISQSGFNIQVHVTLIKSMVMFLILSAISFSCYVIKFTKSHETNGPLYYIIQAQFLIVPHMETMVIIQASPNLRKNLPSWLCFRRTSDN